MSDLWEEFDEYIDGRSDHELLLMARQISRTVRLRIGYDVGTQMKAALHVVENGLEMAMRELDAQPSLTTTCEVCWDRGGPGPLDPCTECGKYGPLDG